MRGGERETERGRSWQSRQFVQKLRSRKRERERAGWLNLRLQGDKMGWMCWSLILQVVRTLSQHKDNGKLLEACKQRGTWSELSFLSSSR